jgi:hypothetical protein
VSAFEKAFPQVGISNDALEYGALCDLIRPFLFEHVRWLSAHEIPFILDAYYVRPQDLLQLQVPGGFAAVFLGYPSADVNERLRTLREKEKNHDWTSLFD